MTQYIAILCISIASAAAVVLSLPADAAASTQWELPVLSTSTR